MSKEEFQGMFKITRGKTSSSPAGLHYMIQKKMAKEDYSAEIMYIMTSLPFVHGFACKQWLHEIDVILERKRTEQRKYANCGSSDYQRRTSTHH